MVTIIYNFTTMAAALDSDTLEKNAISVQYVPCLKQLILKQVSDNITNASTTSHTLSTIDFKKTLHLHHTS